jgi:hypothetical protein
MQPFGVLGAESSESVERSRDRWSGGALGSLPFLPRGSALGGPSATLSLRVVLAG